MIGKIIFGQILIPLGILIMIKAHKIVDSTIGSLGFAERYLGSGGTYTLVRFVGAGIAIIAMLLMFGIGSSFYDAIIAPMGKAIIGI